MDLTLYISFGILIGCAIGLSWFAGSDAPYVPTKMDDIRKILKLAGVKKGKRFYELGSGDGRVVLVAAKLGADSYGIEQSWIRILYSKYKSWKLASHISSPRLRGRSDSRSGNVKFYHGDLFKRTYEDADIIYIFLLHKGVRKLEEKLKKELKKGSIIITQTYHFPNWKPFKKEGDFWLYRV